MAVAILDTDIFPYRTGKGVSPRDKGGKNSNRHRQAPPGSKPTIDDFGPFAFPKRIERRRPRPRGYYA